MPAKLRLQRHGKKGFSFYHIVVADSRAPRDGKFIEKIGTYNPNTNPATIEINSEKALEWLKAGAQPTDTCNAILKYKGIMLKYHLYKGIKKGALTQEQADAKFTKWESEKESKIAGKTDKVKSEKNEAARKRLEAETKAKEAKAAKVAAKLIPPAPAAEEAAPVVEAAAPVVEQPAAEPAAEATPPAEGQA